MCVQTEQQKFWGKSIGRLYQPMFDRALVIDVCMFFYYSSDR